MSKPSKILTKSQRVHNYGYYRESINLKTFVGTFEQYLMYHYDDLKPKQR
jgi:hypothetical protein